jgi:hypothetical protein
MAENKFQTLKEHHFTIPKSNISRASFFQFFFLHLNADFLLSRSVNHVVAYLDLLTTLTFFTGASG